MKLVRLITSVLYIISLSLMQTLCASLRIDHHHQQQKLGHFDEKGRTGAEPYYLPMLPRKLRVLLTGNAEDKMMTHSTVGPNKDHEDVSSAAGGNTSRVYRSNDVEKKTKKEEAGGSKKGGAGGIRWQAYRASGSKDGGDTSEYFTMDYSHVRRRRPIHNKSLPSSSP